VRVEEIEEASFSSRGE
jgi:hypothetical protein